MCLGSVLSGGGRETARFFSLEDDVPATAPGNSLPPSSPTLAAPSLAGSLPAARVSGPGLGSSVPNAGRTGRTGLGLADLETETRSLHRIRIGGSDVGTTVLFQS